MSNISYRDYTLALAAGVAQSLEVVGDYWQLIAATSGVTLMFDDTITIKRFQGMGGGANYRRVSILSDAAQNVTIALGNTLGRLPYDSRAQFAGSVLPVAQKVSNVLAPKNAVTVNPGARAVLVGAQPAAVSRLISIPSNAPVGTFVFIGDASVVNGTGFLMEPGDRLTIDGNFEIDAWNAGGAAVTIYILETQVS